MQDEILLKKLISKDEEVLESTIEQYHKLLWIIVESILGKVGTAEDIEECISDVFIRLWEKPTAFNPNRGSIKIFLCVMARSMALNKYKSLSKSKVLKLDELILSNNDDLIDLIFNKNMIGEIYKAICKMKEPDKEILIRRYFFEEKPSQIADKIFMDVKEVENKLYQGKKKLKNIFMGARL